MSSEVQALIIGALIGLASSLVGILVNHWLTLQREKLKLKLEAEQALRKRLTEGVSPDIIDKSAEKLYAMIERGELPRAYALDPNFLADLLDDLEAEE
jgi:hypothetical protein